MLSLGLNLVKTAISRVTSLVIHSLRSSETDGSNQTLRASILGGGMMADLRANKEE
tara:strand:+ start:74 stop:241 length:168 start_codon:yes stop_codon:yes gene_type:complete